MCQLIYRSFNPINTKSSLYFFSMFNKKHKKLKIILRHLIKSYKIKKYSRIMSGTQKWLIKTKLLIIMMSYLMCSPWFCCVFSVLMNFLQPPSKKSTSLYRLPFDSEKAFLHWLVKINYLLSKIESPN